MRFAWHLGLVYSLALPLCFYVQAAPLEDGHFGPAEVIIETEDSVRPTIVRGGEIYEPYVPSVPGYVSPGYVTVAVRSLSPREIEEFTVPGGMQFPLAIPAWISSSFGYRIHPVTGESRFHQGTDIAAAEGTPVLAAWEGKVEVAGWMGGLGFAVVISHNDGALETRYGHLSAVLVREGENVRKGQPIGLVGSTGLSTGPHLHFELWENQGGEWVVRNPTAALISAMARLETHLARRT